MKLIKLRKIAQTPPTTPKKLVGKILVEYRGDGKGSSITTLQNSGGSTCANQSAFAAAAVRWLAEKKAGEREGAQIVKRFKTTEATEENTSDISIENKENALAQQPMAEENNEAAEAAAHEEQQRAREMDAGGFGV